MNQKIETISLQGKDYAKVADRIKAFREDCPNGSIITEPEVKDNQIIVKATIKKDLKNETSAEATAHALGEKKGQKAFEKTESIAIGRALAVLGYMASGEIASSEEMEEFIEYIENKKLEAIATLNNCKTLDELKGCFMSLGSLMGDKSIIAVKDKLKLTLTK